MLVSVHRPQGGRMPHRELRDRVEAFVRARIGMPRGARVVVGVSGGVDSVTLLHLLHALGFDVWAAHVDYGLRGAESDADAALVRTLCARWEVPLRVRPVEAFARQVEAEGSSLHAAARRLRYRFFDEVARAGEAGYVAVGHHRDDQAETLLLNLFRGCGVEGLAAMAPVRPLGLEGDVRLVRPLLEVSRADVEQYARACELPWRDDASNHDPQYRRGFVRTQVLPLLEGRFGPSVVENVARAAGLVRRYLEASVQPELQARFEAAATEPGTLQVGALRRSAPVWRDRLVLEALRRWAPQAPQTAAVAREVAALVEAQVGRRMELGPTVVWRERGLLRFVAAPSERADEAIALPLGRAARVGGRVFRAEMLDGRPLLDDGDPQAAIMDGDRLHFPLTVRPWRPGDRLRPLGMEGHKKVSDLLTDAKVPPHERRQVLVVCSGEAVVWVAGVRLSADARVRSGTRRYVQVSYDELQRKEEAAEDSP